MVTLQGLVKAALAAIALATVSINISVHSAAAQSLELQDGGPTSTLDVAVDTAVVLESDQPFVELSIANPEIADISTLSDSAIYVLGKTPGRTTLILVGEDGKILNIVNILVTQDITEFETRLQEILPGEDITAFTANDGIVLSGTVSSASSMQQAIALAQRYAGDRVTNLMVVEAAEPQSAEIDIDEFRARLADLLPDEDITVGGANGGLVLSGTVSTRQRLGQAVDLAERYAPGKVSNLLTSGEVQEAPPADLLLEQIRAVFPRERISVNTVANTVILSGTVTSADRIGQTLELVRVFAPSAEITNLLSVQDKCTIRTRRGGELVETTVPCAD
ncbi:Flp pilus assembly secretin CpaC [Rhodovulum iodosum]|uniref:Flp pilus assembly secretin CpaC n=1 Tax=Rhodovulum iodosum TaxID=68291 RepID=A0ABV3XUZ0_9RHOB|nr:BON domain-containing protein [Rhodovulum robiginosum]RSK40783.1 BON domain-containing protein [Rhodovulum robiginosum]